MGGISYSPWYSSKPLKDSIHKVGNQVYKWVETDLPANFDSSCCEQFNVKERYLGRDIYYFYDGARWRRLLRRNVTPKPKTELEFPTRQQFEILSNKMSEKAVYASAEKLCKQLEEK